MLPQKLEEVIGLDHADSAFPLVYLDVPGRKCRAKSSKWLGLMGNEATYNMGVLLGL